MPTELPIEETYSYLIIRTEEEKKAAEPKLKTDEYRHEVSWHAASCDCSQFCIKGIYRRRIDPGEGYRIVGLGQVLKPGDQYLSKAWFNWGSLEPSSDVIICRDWMLKNPDVKAFRRKIEPATEPKQEPKGWVLCSDGKPKDNRLVLVAMAHFRAVCQLINGEWIESFSGRNYGTVTHWRELPKEELPPIKSPDDAAFEEWELNRFNGSKLGFDYRENAQLAFKAGISYARKATK